ncbi:hypothetical protein ABZV78_03535 [Micromonospora sp. NPDC004540]|uniref:hypothetical protein n=1 Tax=Micromonospora sp. NPDC004540 TaxID=3154457 RepID=UPI0033B0DDD2
MEPRNLNRHFAALWAKAGCPDVRLHDLRHPVVSLLMELGVPPHIVQAIARHADLKAPARAVALSSRIPATKATSQPRSFSPARPS